MAMTSHVCFVTMTDVTSLNPKRLVMHHESFSMFSWHILSCSASLVNTLSHNSTQVYHLITFRYIRSNNLISVRPSDEATFCISQFPHSLPYNEDVNIFLKAITQPPFLSKAIRLKLSKRGLNLIKQYFPNNTLLTDFQCKIVKYTLVFTGVNCSIIPRHYNDLNLYYYWSIYHSLL